MLKDLVKLANHLDSKGLQKEADVLDSLITKWAESELPMSEEEAIERYKSNRKAWYKDLIKNRPYDRYWEVYDSIESDIAELEAYYKDDPLPYYKREGTLLEYISKEGIQRIVEWFRNPQEWLLDYNYEGVEVREDIKAAAKLYINHKHKSSPRGADYEMINNHDIERWMVNSFGVSREEAKLTLDSIKNEPKGF